jgi:DNA-binding response OmpR family regulator
MRRDAQQPAGTPRILVVEDDRALRRVLEFALSAGGWAVDLAENGQHGLTRLAASEPDAVVLDVGLPDIDGIALCRRLRRAGNRVPVLLVSARDGIEHRVRGLDAGADDYLCKPFDVDFGPEANSLRVYVGYLRRKLAQAGARSVIHTVRGVGHVLREP